MVLAANAWDEDRETIARFAAKKKLHQRFLLDAGEVSLEYGATSMPTVLWIDREGRIVDAQVGLGSRRSLAAKTKALLARQ